MPDLPAGVVTFMLTDIEGSTRLWEAHPAAMPAVVARHDTILGEAAAAHDGLVLKNQGEGDSLFAVFSRATDAVAAAVTAQCALAAEPWGEAGPLRVRMALHSGEAELRDGDYYGATVNRCARLRAVAHGGQVLLSAAVQELVRDHLPAETGLRELGEHRLRDLARPERVFQAVAPGLPADFPPPRSLDTLPTNLPLQLTSFVGRERELAEVKRLLATTRLLTLTGAGGVGKTRLALQVAADLADQYPDGVWLVELASLPSAEITGTPQTYSEPALVAPAVSAVLAVREEPGRPLTATLVDALARRELLLLLDNCEHLVTACARLADALLRACPRVTLLTTSREALGVAGEMVWRVPSLAVPDPRRLPPVERLSQYEAVRLFIERAAFVLPGFTVTNASAPAVAQICHRLDGIALAIELAAARVRVLSVDQIAARLDDRFRLLTGGSRTALPRQQTLRAAIDWSHDLLDTRERTVLERLSVFAGGFELEAATAVCAGGPIEAHDVLDLLTQLVDKSLVLAEPQAGEVRYRLLESMRRYGEEKLEAVPAAATPGGDQGDLLDSQGEALRAPNEAAAVRARYRDWYVALAARARQALWGAEQAAWLEWVEREQDNLRAVLRLDMDAAARVRLWEVLWRFWEVRGHAEGMLLADHYLLAAALGHGGFGAVYRATDQRTGETVAVKILRPSLAPDPRSAARVRQEAEITAALASPRVVRVLDLGEHAGIPFMVMEYVPGPGLHGLLRERGRFPAAEALTVGLELARVLETVHARGIVLNDLKPHNVKLADGHVKVLDLGIARLEWEAAATEADAVIGTPEYMAPERVTGWGDIRADIYALGVILFELLEGRVPFQGPTARAVLAQHRTTPPPALSGAVPAVVRDLVMRCLAKDPAARYQTPSELAEALDAALDALPPARATHPALAALLHERNRRTTS